MLLKMIYHLLISVWIVVVVVPVAVLKRLSI